VCNVWRHSTSYVPFLFLFLRFVLTVAAACGVCWCCLQYDRLLLIFIVPLVVLLMLGLVPSIILELRNRCDLSDSNRTRRNRVLSRKKIIRLLVFALFLM
jgi:hypothetical protein